MWNLIPAAIGLGVSTAKYFDVKGNKDKYMPDTSYMDRYINSLRSRKRSSETYNLAMRPVLRQIGSQVDRTRRANRYELEKAGMQGSGVGLQQNLSTQRQQLEATTRASDRALQLQNQENRRINQNISQTMLQKGQIEAEAEANYKRQLDNAKWGMIGSAGAAIGSTVAHFGQQFTNRNQAFAKGKELGIIGEDVSREQFGKDVREMGLPNYMEVASQKHLAGAFDTWKEKERNEWNTKVRAKYDELKEEGKLDQVATMTESEFVEASLKNPNLARDMEFAYNKQQQKLGVTILGEIAAGKINRKQLAQKIENDEIPPQFVGDALNLQKGQLSSDAKKLYSDIGSATSREEMNAIFDEINKMNLRGTEIRPIINFAQTKMNTLEGTSGGGYSPGAQDFIAKINKATDISQLPNLEEIYPFILPKDKSAIDKVWTNKKESLKETNVSDEISETRDIITQLKDKIVDKKREMEGNDFLAKPDVKSGQEELIKRYEEDIQTQKNKIRELRNIMTLTSKKSLNPTQKKNALEVLSVLSPYLKDDNLEEISKGLRDKKGTLLPVTAIKPVIDDWKAQGDEVVKNFVSMSPEDSKSYRDLWVALKLKGYGDNTMSVFKRVLERDKEGENTKYINSIVLGD